MRKLKPEEQLFIDKLYRKEFYNLCDFAKKAMHGSPMAKDIVQDTFVLACTKIDILIEHPKPGGWLLDALQKNINNYWRVKDYIAKMIIDVPMEKWTENYPDYRVLEDDLDLLYGDLVKYKEYEILKKFAVEGYSTKEIACEFGIKTNTCKQRIFRAKKTLQKIWEKYNEN